MKQRILFVTRSYPPQIGGMEQYSYDFYETLRRHSHATLLANTKGKKNLPFFLVHAALYLLKNRKKFSHIHLGDAALSMLIPLAKTSANHVSSTAHGLDITYTNKMYQSILRRNLSKADAVICVSEHTKKECVLRGIPSRKCFVIPNGIRTESIKKISMPLAALEKQQKISLMGKKILLSVSRLVKRKGHEWFVRSVMPKLAGEYVLIVAGAGPEYDNIQRAAVESGVSSRVFLLGRVTEQEKVCMYANSHVFIMPNVHVPGDMEGFGISLIEAAAYGLPSVAARLEGITDAVIDRKTGLLVTPANAASYVRAIGAVQRMKRSSVKKAAELFDWNRIIKEYLAVLHE